MKVFIAIIVFSFFTFPVFSQNPNINRFNALGAAIASTYERNREALADFDERILIDGTVQRFARFLRHHHDLAAALEASEFHLNFLLRGSAHRTLIMEEHQNFGNLMREMEALRIEYDAWLRTVQ